ncbi:MAG: thermonuclease family protein [Anaerolineales bacterium]
MDKKQVLIIGIGALFVFLVLGVSGVAALRRLGMLTTATPTITPTVTPVVPPRAPTIPAVPSNTPAPVPTRVPPTATSPSPRPDIWLPFVSVMVTPTQAVSNFGFDCLQSEPLQAMVTSVVDGDTIRVKIAGQETYLRYIGVDSPEDTDQHVWLGLEAAEENRLLVDGKRVLLFKDTSETDSFDRLLRYVLLEDGTFVNLEMVRSGLAQARAYPPDTACRTLFASAETQARQAALGLWSATPTPEPTPSPPAAAPAQPAQAACDCRGPDLDCSDFGSQAQAQACFDACQSQGRGDIFNLDGDHDGRVCERLP